MIKPWRSLDLYRTVQAFNNDVVGPEVDRSAAGLSLPIQHELNLGVRLLLEEVEETIQALGFNITIQMSSPRTASVNLFEALDGIVDITYVLYGLSLRLGISPNLFYAAFEEVSRANFAKAGGPIREDGKRLKPEGWTPPDLFKVYEEYQNGRTR